MSWFVNAVLEDQTDHVLADILWKVSSLNGLEFHREDLDFDGWIFCYLDFSKASRHSSLAVLSLVFGNPTVGSFIIISNYIIKYYKNHVLFRNKM